MLRPIRSGLLSFLNSFQRPSAGPRPRVQLRVDELEGRLVPSTMPAVDLSTAGSIGSVSGAIFRQVATQPAGCGVMDPFVRLQGHSGSGITQGYNTDGRPLQFDEKSSANFTRAEPLSAVPVVNVGGIRYREFLLNINQTNSTPYLSLDELRLYTGEAPNLLNYNSTTHQLSGLNAGFDLGAGNWIKLNSGLNPGNGKANMVALIPDSDFGSGTYVYLYSKFGVNLPAHGGFESWGVSGSSTPLTDTTGSISGTVFNDLNGDGKLEAGEGGLGGWTVFLDANGDGIPDNGEATAITQSNGSYSFGNLAVGLGSFSTYTVRVVQQPGYNATTATAVTIDLSSVPGHAATVNFGEQVNPIGGMG